MMVRPLAPLNRTVEEATALRFISSFFSFFPMVGFDLCLLVYVVWSETAGRKLVIIINSGGLMVAI